MRMCFLFGIILCYMCFLFRVTSYEFRVRLIVWHESVASRAEVSDQRLYVVPFIAKDWKLEGIFVLS